MRRSSRPSLARLAVLVAALVAAAAGPPVAVAATPTATVDQIFAGAVTGTSPCNAQGTGIQSVTAAGSVTDFCFALHTSKVSATGDDLQSTTIDSPRGVLANVDSAPQCTAADFAAATTAAATCAANSQVGASSANIRVQLVGSVELPLSVQGEVFNLQHTVNEVGLLGIQLDPQLGPLALPKVKLVLRFTLRPAPDVGLRAVVDHLPETADTGLLGVKPIATDDFTFRFWGSKLTRACRCRSRAWGAAATPRVRRSRRRRTPGRNRRRRAPTSRRAATS